MPKNFVGEPFSVSLISGTEKVWIRGGRGVSRFSVENFRRGILYCCNNFGYRKSFDKGGGSITIFRRSFCLTVPKYFIGEHFGVSEKFFYRKFSCIGGGASRFCRNFLSHRTENFRKGVLLFLRKFLVSKSFMDEKGVSRFSVENFWSQCRKISWASLQCLRKFYA